MQDHKFNHRAHCAPFQRGNMKTLSDFKRALTLGSKWHAIFHYNEKQSELGTGEVIKVQSNAVKFKRGEKESWLHFPKSSHFSISNDVACIFVGEGEEKTLRLTYYPCD